MTERQGNWMQTYTGKQFYPIDHRPEDFDIKDIAHALSNMCRYAGHCKKFYSVAEHSVFVADQASPENKLWGLLHDASEAYLVDIPRPTKPYLSNYYELEDKLMTNIGVRFGLSGSMPAEVKEIDNRILMDEKKQNMRKSSHQWNNYGEPLGVKLEFWKPEQAEFEFLRLFYKLTE